MIVLVIKAAIKLIMSVVVSAKLLLNNMPLMIKELFKDKIFVRYLLSGALVSLMELVVFAWLIYFCDWAYLAASAVIFFFGLIMSFVLRKLWVFSTCGLYSSRKQLLFYSTVFATSTLVNLLIMYVLIDRFNLSKLLSQIIAMTLVGFFTFTANKTITFKPLPTRDLSLVKYIESQQLKD